MHKVTRKLRLICFAVLVFTFTFVTVVEAEDTIVNKQICLSNRNLYNISWDSTKNTRVTTSAVDSISQSNIQDGYGYVSYPAGTTGAELDKYKFNATLLGTNCYTASGKIHTCPSNEELNFYDMNKLLEFDKETGQYKKIVIDYSETNRNFKIKIPDLYSGKIKVRYVANGESQNAGGLNQATSYSKFVAKEGNYFVINNIPPSTYYQTASGDWDINESNVLIEFYINDSKSKCNNTYIASINLVMSMIDETVEIDNPALSDDSYGCGPVKAYVNQLLEKGIVEKDTEFEKTLKYSLASLCYNTKISYDEYKTLKDGINTQFTRLKEFYGDLSDIADSDIKVENKIFCEQSKTLDEKTVLTAGGSWWQLVCKEKYVATGTHAKLVRAGGGFTYESEFTATRTCTLSQKRKAHLKPKCQYWCATSCVWMESTGEKTGPSAGPNEEFDACVVNCDGGKYSQQCINSCYKNVYGDDNNRKLPVLNNEDKKTSFLLDNYSIEKTGNVVGEVTSSAGGTFVGWSQDAAGNPKAVYRVDVPTSHGGNVGVTYTSYCDNHNGKCTIYEHHGPSGCSDTPEADYASELNASASEFNHLLGLMKKEIPTGEYTIMIADSYLNNDGHAYTYEISSKNNPEIVSTSTDSSCSSQTWTFGDRGETGTGCGTSTYTKTVKVKLADAYLNKNTGSAVYETAKDKYSAFNSKTKETRLELVKDFTKANYYYAKNKYYTNTWSNDVNVVGKEDKVTLVDYNTYKNDATKQANIAVKVTKFGTNNKYSNQVDCFYGVYNDTIQKCSSPPCLEDDDDDGDGLQIIFRPIDLTDNFPNERNARWNWKNKASVTDTTSTLYKLLNYKIAPEALNKEIENKGYKIYEDTAEIDYDITLTPKQLRAIKDYNKGITDINNDGSNNYLDYDMSCSKVGSREYCYSKFLDNEHGDHITYNTGYSKDTRKDIAICNNTYNGACVDIGGTK